MVLVDYIWIFLGHFKAIYQFLKHIIVLIKIVANAPLKIFALNIVKIKIK
jgi:hypothetical protein